MLSWITELVLLLPWAQWMLRAILHRCDIPSLLLLVSHRSERGRSRPEIEVVTDDGSGRAAAWSWGSCAHLRLTSVPPLKGLGVACLSCVCSHRPPRKRTPLSFKHWSWSWGAPSSSPLVFPFVSSKRDRVVFWIHSHSVSITFKDNLFPIFITLLRGLGPRKLSSLMLSKSILTAISPSRKARFHLWQKSGEDGGGKKKEASEPKTTNASPVRRIVQ